MKKEVTVSPAYLKKKKGQVLNPVLISIRVYQQNKIIRFNYYLNDVDGKPIRLIAAQMKAGVVVEHHKNIRYTSLISFVSKKIRQFVNDCLIKNRNVIPNEINEKVAKSINQEFEVDFTDTLDDQKISVETLEYGEILVDKAVLDSFSKTDFSTEPEVLPDGSAEFNDLDRSDLEDILYDEQAIADKEKKKIIELRFSTEVRFKEESTPNLVK